ncbi:hypothetical protein FOL47_009589 [Perkinsus chesapeaki]|uniref:PH domain-containing protein n=1 Tax=Perkinsus chesapeaki TaxID=330153 RepID=A0A7J6MRJ7_PERCH|nr:hypothetical protein FOL47_009589 [Perkinsus chesapeaki]
MGVETAEGQDDAWQDFQRATASQPVGFSAPDGPTANVRERTDETHFGNSEGTNIPENTATRSPTIPELTRELPGLEELIEKAIEDAGPLSTVQTASTPSSGSPGSESVMSEDLQEIRACAPVLTEFDLEDQEATRMRIYVHSDHGRHAVGWFSDVSSPEDVRECILAAVGSITDDTDKVFKLRSRRKGTIIDLDSYEDLPLLRRGAHYDLLVGERLTAGRNGDERTSEEKWRRLKVPIDPLKHIEATKALHRYSAGLDRKECMINLSDVCELRLGQQTSTFAKYRLPMLEHLSFSLIYKVPEGETSALDITCKDEFEYDAWLTGLKALLCAQRNRTISKEQLLAHSRRFQKAVKEKNVRVKLLELAEVKERGTVGLDDCVKVSPSTSPPHLRKKLDRLRERLKYTKLELDQVLETRGTEVVRKLDGVDPITGVDWSLAAGTGPAYASLLSEITEVEDDEMEACRAVELAEDVLKILDRVSSDLMYLEHVFAGGVQTTENMTRRQRELDQLLWKAEVDIENVEDMRRRLLGVRRSNPGSLLGVLPAPAVADMRSSLDAFGHQVEEQLANSIEALKELFGQATTGEHVQLPPGPNR